MLRKFAARCIITILKHLQKYTLEHQAATIAGVCGEMLVESLISTEIAHKKQFEHIYTTTHDIEACFVYAHATSIWTNPSNANEYLHSMQTIVCSLQRSISCLEHKDLLVERSSISTRLQGSPIAL